MSLTGALETWGEGEILKKSFGMGNRRWRRICPADRERKKDLTGGILKRHPSGVDRKGSKSEKGRRGVGGALLLVVRG